jgi:hypothetical protein
MRTYSFTLTLAGVDVLTPAVSGALFEAGINGGENTLVYSRDGSVFVDYEVESGSLALALASAVEKIERAGYGVAKVEVEEPAEVG